MFRLNIQTGNAAFAGDPGAEVARIIRELAGHIASLSGDGNEIDDGGNVFDRNGNRVGTWSLDTSEETP
ncbi:MAG: hypothetical protein V4527_18915 [Pseudomonadota bacterium]